MVLSRRAVVGTRLPKVQTGASCAVLLAAFAACSVYEPSMIGRSHDRPSSAGGVSEPASGGKTQSADGLTEVSGDTGGAPNGQGKARGGSESTGGIASVTTSGRSADGGKAGYAGAMSRGGGGGMMGEDVLDTMQPNTGGSHGGGATSGDADPPAIDGAGASGANGGAAGTSAGGATADVQGGSTTATGGAGSGGGGTTGTDGAATGGTAGTAGSGEVCAGCARLSVPLSSSSDRAHFVLSIAANTDLTGATVTLRLARSGGMGGKLRAYIQDSGPDYHIQFSPSINLSSLSPAMSTFTFKVDASISSADITDIERVGVEIAGEGSSSFTSPILIDIDSISVAGEWVTDQSFRFHTADSISTTPTENGPIGKMWLNSHKADTNVSGAAIEWLGP